MSTTSQPAATAPYDVAIVGAGVAGLVLSMLLKRAGIRHVLLSRKEVRKPLALGETMPPSAYTLLDRLALTPLFEANATRTFGYHSMWGNNRVVNQNFFGHQPCSNGLKLDKPALMAALEAEVLEQVLPFDELNAVEATKTNTRITITSGKERSTLVANVLVDATGRARAVLKRLGVGSRDYDELVALYCHVPRHKHPQLQHGVCVESFEEGWGIVSTLDDERCALTLFTNKGNRVLGALKHYENWKQVLQGSSILKDFLSPEPLSKVLGRQANSSKAEQLAGANWLVVGDAAIAFDPISSHGVTNALYGASRAFRAISQHLPAPNGSAFGEYQQTLNGIFEGYLQHRAQLYARERRWSGPFWEQVASPVGNAFA